LEAATKTTDEIVAHGGSAYPVDMDVSNAEQVAACFEALSTKGLLPGVVMNCAGVVDEGDAPVDELDELSWDRTIEVNLKGTYLVCKNAIPAMLERGRGCIINMASRAALNGTSHHAYSASKGGVAALSRSIGVTYASRGIRCNAIAPGPIATAMTSPWMSDEAEYARRVAGVPARRVGSPEEVAALALYLASDQASFVNATMISIDGGASAV
jgi:3-oxoacyl-[acyl-carrier protein] reductase